MLWLQAVVPLASFFTLTRAQIGVTEPLFPLGNPDLSHFPSVKDKVTLYRGISNSEELASTRNLIGKSPEYTSSSFGDYNADGSPVLYFWDDIDDADAWCEHRLSSDQRAKFGITQCAVGTYQWNPPAGVRVKRYTRADAEWQGLVRTNWLGPGVPVSPIQKDNDWIEGPVSIFFQGNYVPEATGLSMQHALVSTLMLPHLTITSVTPDFECLDCKQDGDMGSINMGNQWNPQIVKRVDPMPDSICPGFNFGIVNRGPIRSTSGVTYSVVDASCREAKQTTTQNPCNDPLFSCSPAPIVFTALHLNGLDYACRTDPRAGSCHGEAVQYCCRNDGR